MRTKLKKVGMTIIFCLSLVTFLVSVTYLGAFFIKRYQNHQIYEEVNEKNRVKQEVDIQEETATEEQIEIPIDFASLKEINPEIYAWIDIEDTSIHYPIAQSATDDSYYLEHTIEGVKGYPGSIYTERVNAKDFSDFNTVIYGHRMNTGIMFNHLSKFTDAEFFESHDTIMIYTETEIKEYRVYAAIVYDARHIIHSFEQDSVEGQKKFIASLHNCKNWQNHFREEMTIDENSHLITLSTCVKNQPDKRYIVVAEEVKSIGNK